MLKIKVMQKPDGIVDKHSIIASGIIENANYFNYYPKTGVIDYLLHNSKGNLVRRTVKKGHILYSAFSKAINMPLYSEFEI